MKWGNQMTLRLRENYKVEFDHVDFKGYLSINGISSYMQIIAGNHASILGFNYYMNQGMPEYYWILSRVKYVIDEYPKWEDDIQMETYPGGCEKLFAVRLFDLYNKEGNPIGHIIGDYILMDTHKKRPARIKGNETLAFLDFPYEGEVLTKLKAPIEDIKNQAVYSEKRKAYYSELDLNGHMNNAHYVRWVADMFSVEQYENYEIAELEINYNVSITYGTEVEIFLVPEEDETHYTICGNSLDGKVQYFISKVKLRKRVK